MEFTDQELIALYHRVNISKSSFSEAYKEYEYKEDVNLVELWQKIADECVKRELTTKRDIYPKLKPKEVTMKEVCEKFGQEVKIIKE